MPEPWDRAAARLRHARARGTEPVVSALDSSDGTRIFAVMAARPTTGGTFFPAFGLTGGEFALGKLLAMQVQVEARRRRRGGPAAAATAATRPARERRRRRTDTSVAAAPLEGTK
jgi:hypothetical protein